MYKMTKYWQSNLVNIFICLSCVHSCLLSDGAAMESWMDCLIFTSARPTFWPPLLPVWSEDVEGTDGLGLYILCICSVFTAGCAGESSIYLFIYLLLVVSRRDLFDFRMLLLNSGLSSRFKTTPTQNRTI